MKLAYINVYSCYLLAGLRNKVEAQARAAREAGLDIDFLVLYDGPAHSKDNIRFIQIPFTCRKGILKKIEQTLFKYRFISRLVDLDKYDCIIFRYPFADDFTVSSFFRKFGHKTITEHHTNELAEMRLSWFRDKLMFFRYGMEKINAARMLSKVAGLIGVTDEIRRIELEKSGYKPSAVVSNGINIEVVRCTGFIPFDGKTLKILAVVSESAPWQGLDRLLRGLQQYRGNIAAELIIAGAVSGSLAEHVQGILRPSISVHMPGVLSGYALDEVFSGATIAVSTLGLYRKRMKEACPLKSREYVARGIPFIYAYDDPDIPEDCRFSLKFENDSSPIDMQRVIDFAETVSKNDGLSQYMRKYAEEVLDWKVKMKQLYEFAQSVVMTGNIR